MAETCRLFDSHLHLQDRRLDNRLDAVIEEAKSAGVQYFACNGCCEEDWDKARFIRTRSVKWLEKLRQYLETEPQAGVGECGLDRSRRAEGVDIDEQADVMIQQVKLAKELERPVSVHCVQAFGKLQEIMQKYAPFPQGFILHSWAGNAEQVKQLSKIEGVHFSISGHTLNSSSKKLEPMLREIPQERLLLETDAPDGLPQRDGAQPLETGDDKSLALNHPANIRVVLEAFAKATGQEPAACARIAYKNAAALFLR